MSHDHYIQKFQCGHVHSQCRCASREKREIVVPKNCPDCSTVVPVSRDTLRPRSALDQQVDYGCGLCEWERRPVGAKNAELVRVKQCLSCRLGSIREDIASVPGVGYKNIDLLLTTLRQQVLQEVKKELMNHPTCDDPQGCVFKWVQDQLKEAP